jgi:hypothetical protein
MMAGLRGSAAILLYLASAGPVQSQTLPSAPRGNTAVLRGKDPIMWNTLPPLPPAGFYAWCSTPRGLCPVQGNAPIAPGSGCHCGEHAGRTM